VISRSIGKHDVVEVEGLRRSTRVTSVSAFECHGRAAVQVIKHIPHPDWGFHRSSHGTPQRMKVKCPTRRSNRAGAAADDAQG
jgi:hypothetical protein